MYKQLIIFLLYKSEYWLITSSIAVFVDYNGECSVSAQCVTAGASCRDDGAGADRCLCDLTGQHYDDSIDECLAGSDIILYIIDC